MKLSFLHDLRSWSPRRSFNSIKKNKRYTKSVAFIKRRPFTSFFLTLAAFLLFLIIGSVVTQLSKREPVKVVLTKAVQVYTIGKTPTVSLQAKIEKSGVVKIVAQAPGVVQAIKAKEGDSVAKGQTIISLSSNYQGGSAPALQAQLAASQLRNTLDTYGLQKDIITRQRDIATASAENTEQLRQISQKTLNDTRGLLDLNRSILDSFNDQVQQNPNDIALKAQQSQYRSVVDQLQSTVNSLDYSTNTSNPPTLLSNAQKEITLKQLAVQEKALDLNKQVSKIQYNLALVQEGTMNPASPFAGTVERVLVSVGESVSPGDVLAVVTSSDIVTTAVLQAPQTIAASISRVDPTRFHFGDKTISLTPTYVSTVATEGQLYSVMYNLPEGINSSVTAGNYVEVDVPVGYANTNSVMPFVPIDSVFISQDESTVFVITAGKAATRKIKMGDVYGQYVAVVSGLYEGDQVILNRNVIAGDKVKISQ